jgi:iron(III) transport system ATP-binding protein
MTVRQNVEYPLRARGKKDALRSGRAREILSLVRCDHLTDRLPAELSGGQQQRVALARALAAAPALVLFDEPLSNLDAVIRVELRSQLRQLHSTLGYTGIYVTHDQVEALSLGDRVAVMRAGRIEQLTSPAELFARPLTDYVASFVGLRNRIPLRLEGRTLLASAGPVRLTMDAPVGALAMHVRPEDVSVASPDGPGLDGACLEGIGHVVEVLYAGLDVEYVVQFGTEMLFAKTTRPQMIFSPGDRARIAIAADHALVYSDGHLVWTDAVPQRLSAAT